MIRLENLRRQSRLFYGAMALAIMVVVGTVDYLTGVEITFSVFYLVPIGMAAWFVGYGFAVALSVLSVIVWLGGDIAAGANYSSAFVPVWNAVISVAFYLVVIWLFRKLRTTHDELEERVRHRTAALTEEMAERERLEKEILDIGERERQRIGRDLHDSVGQHLTGTAMAGQVLQEKLATSSAPEVADANRLVRLLEHAIELTRQLARGLAPIEMTDEGLMDSLRELAAITEERFKISCHFSGTEPVLIHDSATALHLYRIAQEAVNNAVKHAAASSIVIRLYRDNHAIILDVQDNGLGLPEPLPRGSGMGLRIMRHRAGMIGATFTVHHPSGGGTRIACTLGGQS